MTEEIKEEQTMCKPECRCFIHCECVQKFFIVALGSFVGVFFALALFAALHRPPCAGPCPVGPKMKAPIEHQQRFDHRQFRGEHRPPMPPMEKPVKR